jgi:hypothetical protein
MGNIQPTQVEFQKIMVTSLFLESGVWFRFSNATLTEETWHTRTNTHKPSSTANKNGKVIRVVSMS